MENIEEKQLFLDIITKHLNGEILSNDEKIKILAIAKSNNFIIEQNETIVEGNATYTTCYWICRGSNWICNPAMPGPGCDCYQVCI